MVLDAFQSLATGFEGCEKKLEIDFHLSPDVDTNLRSIDREQIDEILNLARCSIISVQRNRDFDAYVLSESSLFIYPAKLLIKTCGTTSLLKCVRALLDAAKKAGAEPDFLQFSRSNFLFPNQQHFPHRAFHEETDYLNEQLGIAGDAFILGSLNGARWHLYIWDFNLVQAKEYQQQTLEIIMFNLDQNKMKTFYNRNPQVIETEQEQKEQPQEEKSTATLSASSPVGVGHPCSSGAEATEVSGISALLPGAVIDSHLFTPCGYSCNGLVDVQQMNQIIQQTNRANNPEEQKAGEALKDKMLAVSPLSSASADTKSSSSSSSSYVGKQGSLQQAYFTIHVTPEPQCSFVSFETNAVLPNYTALIRSVVSLFEPSSFCVSLFVDSGALISDSRLGSEWEHEGYTTKGTTHHSFQAGYNATVSIHHKKPTATASS